MLRVAIYTIVFLLVGVGVGAVYAMYGTNVYELLVIPLFVSVRELVGRGIVLFLEAVIRWGWTKTFWLLFLLSLPTIWRHTIRTFVRMVKVRLRAGWSALRAHWSKWPWSVRGVLSAILFCVICLLVVHYEKVFLLLTLAFVSIPLPIRMRMWVSRWIFRLGVRIGVFFGVGLFIRHITNAYANSVFARWVKNCDRYLKHDRSTFLRRVLRRKRATTRKTSPIRPLKQEKLPQE